jgi:DNA-binding GntR family transcriptional regulator
MTRSTDAGPAVSRLERADVHSVEDVVTNALREAILSGDLRPGERLRQEPLADQLRVSRIPLRDALRRLETEGLVQFGPRRGAHVTALAPDDVREIYELRILLEERAIRHAIEALDNVAVKRLLAMSEHMDAHTDDPGEGRKARRAFYSALYEYAGRPRSHKLIVGLRDEVQRYHLIKSVAVSRSDHADLRECIRAKDAERAARLQREHLIRARDDLLQVLEREAGA